MLDVQETRKRIAGLENKASQLVGQASLPVTSQATPAYAGAVPPKYDFQDNQKSEIQNQKFS